MKVRILAFVLAAITLTIGGRTVLGQHGSHAGMDHVGPTGIISALALPTAATARMLLEGAVHTSEYVDVAAGRDHVRVFVSYPDRVDKAPVVVVNTAEGMSDWARATAFQASRDGFIAVAPDYLSGRGPGGGDIDAFSSEEDIVDALNRMSEEEILAKAYAVTRFAAQIPAANGTIASIEVRAGRIAAKVGTAPAASFARNDGGWLSALTFLSEQTGNQFEPLPPHMDHVAMETRAHPSTRSASSGSTVSEVEQSTVAQQGARGGQAGRGAQSGQPRDAPGLNVKPDDLPANWVMAERIVGTTPRRHEWVDVPVPGTEVKVHTWVVYPDGEQKVGAVLVLHGASGVTDWVRGVADQLARDGFIALVADLSSGLGPNEGNFDSFRFMDDRMRATQKLNREAVMARIRAVRDFAAKMPRSNGKTGSIGFCGGGTNSFTLATDVPEHNASVVYYGGPPPMASLAKATAPVLGFYGEDDARIFSTVESTRAEMKRLGKAYESHTYPHATHSFLWMQDLGNNFEATADSWPRTIAFYRQHLSTPAP